MLFDVEQDIHFVAPALGQEVRRDQSRHQEFSTVDTGHLGPADIRDFVQNAQPERQIRVDAAGKRTDKAATEQQLVADEFGVFGGLAQSRGKELGGAHRYPIGPSSGC
jgi:hypothetical protein